MQTNQGFNSNLMDGTYTNMQTTTSTFSQPTVVQSTYSQPSISPSLTQQSLMQQPLPSQFAGGQPYSIRSAQPLASFTNVPTIQPLSAAPGPNFQGVGSTFQGVTPGSSFQGVGPNFQGVGSNFQGAAPNTYIGTNTMTPAMSGMFHLV